jgi:formate hydrogenlyase transcriptional activator
MLSNDIHSAINDAPAFTSRLVARDAHTTSADAIVGSSVALQSVMRQVSLVAQTDTTVLVLGETGTGKELIARAIYERSKRAKRPFVRVNCAAIPASLIASELFGHEKGAFTGAMQRRLGRFEAANGGTIFLDEIGELPMETQVTLLRVLQEREIERVGSSQSIPIDVRIVAATNRDLRAAVAEGTFRQDMFYRLNVFPIHLPALRERRDDIPALVEHLVERYARRVGKTFRSINPNAIELLQAHDWPGNIRELQNFIERAVILCEGELFSIDEKWLGGEAPRQAAYVSPLAATLADREREVIEAALAESKGRVSGPQGAAARLGVPRQTLDSKIASLQISKLRFRAQPSVPEPSYT